MHREKKKLKVDNSKMYLHYRNIITSLGRAGYHIKVLWYCLMLLVCSIALNNQMAQYIVGVIKYIIPK